MPSFTDKITQTFERMSQRERLMVAGLGATFVVLIIALFGYLIMDGLDTRRAQNERIRYVLKRLEKNRDRLVATRQGDDRLYVKLDAEPPALQAHVDGLAKKHEVEVKDYKPVKAKELGAKKTVLEKAVEISIYKIEIDKLGKFLNAIESSGSRFLIMTTQLQVTPRSSHHGQLDVKRLRISTFERNKGKRNGNGSRSSMSSKGMR